MDMITGLAIAASIGALVALVSGIVSMALGGEVAHLTSEKWMGWRVAWQAAALLFIMLGLTATATAQSVKAPQRQCVYDFSMITEAECLAYRDRFIAAKTEPEREALREALYRTMESRARERGVAMTDWRGLALPVNTTQARR